MISLSEFLLRLRAELLRFRTLSVAQRLRLGRRSHRVLRRRLFGYPFQIDVSASDTHALLWLEGERLIAERFLVRSLLRPGMTVVDVGANIGYYLLLFESVIGPSGHVLLIEPSPENLPQLRRTMVINGFANASLEAIAIGAQEGVVGLRSGINSGVAAVDEAPYQVPIRPLDAVAPDRVDVIKIDVEGFELDVLRGAAAVLERDRPSLFLEVHPHILARFGTDMAALMDEVRRFYLEFEIYYLPLPGNSLLSKIAERYLGCDAVCRAENVENFLANIPSYTGSEGSTFWIVARSPR